MIAKGLFEVYDLVALGYIYIYMHIGKRELPKFRGPDIDPKTIGLRLKQDPQFNRISHLGPYTVLGWRKVRP